MSNIQMQKAGALCFVFFQQHLPASDLERSKDPIREPRNLCAQSC